MTIETQSLKKFSIRFPSGTVWYCHITFTLWYQNYPICQVDDEVGHDVGEQLLVDQLVDGPSPLKEDCGKAAERARIGHISCIGHGHDWVLCVTQG